MISEGAFPSYVFEGGFINRLKRMVLFSLPVRLRIKLANVIGWPTIVPAAQQGPTQRPKIMARRDRFGWRYYVVIGDRFREFFGRKQAIEFFVKCGGRIEDIQR